MPPASRSSSVDTPPTRTMAVLHPAFALTGVVHAIGGPLLPSLASTFNLGDSQSGFLFLAYYLGTSVGALLCASNHARSITIGFFALTATSLAIAASGHTLLLPLFFTLGISAGMPMSAISMLAGARFTHRSAAPLTLLNFSWSAGALAAPLLAARLLTGHTYRFAYVAIACAAGVATILCFTQLRNTAERVPVNTGKDSSASFGFISLFAFLTFLEVGIENTTGSWLATYALRASVASAAGAAASSSLFWCGFLASRGLSSLVLLRMQATRLLGIAVAAALAASVLLIALPGTGGRGIAMVILGAALAPIFPLLLARFFSGTRQSSDSRWVLAACGFGGSVLPWLTGVVSAQTGSLRLGLTVIPAALVLIACALPALSASRAHPAAPGA